MSGFLILFSRHFAHWDRVGGLACGAASVPGLIHRSESSRGVCSARITAPACIGHHIVSGVVSALAKQAELQLTHATACGAASAGAVYPQIAHAFAGDYGLAYSDQTIHGAQRGTAGARHFAASRATHSQFDAALATTGTPHEAHHMNTPRTFDVVWREDGTATIVGRLTSPVGSGDATGVKGEGNWVEQSDLSAVTLKVFDVTDGDNVTETYSGTVTIGDSVLDTPRTPTGVGADNSNALWDADDVGYNFLHDIPASAFPTGGNTYVAEYKFVFAGGAVGWGVFRGEAMAVYTE